MSFYIVKGDLFARKVDAIVIPGAPHMRLEGSIGKQAAEKCGDLFIKEMDQLKNIPMGTAAIVNAYNLPGCKKIIYVANPKWIDGNQCEEDDLENCYKDAIALAQEFCCGSIAFPLLSSGANRFSLKKALEIALSAIKESLEDYDMEICLVIGKESVISSYKGMLSGIPIIDDINKPDLDLYVKYARNELRDMSWYSTNAAELSIGVSSHPTFNELLEHFRVMKGQSKTDLYTGIVSKAAYNNYAHGATPNKYTAVAFGLRLKLSVYEINELLAPLGQRLFRDLEKDRLIIQEIEHGADVYQVNKVLIANKYLPLKAI